MGCKQAHEYESQVSTELRVGMMVKTKDIFSKAFIEIVLYQLTPLVHTAEQ